MSTARSQHAGQLFHGPTVLREPKSFQVTELTEELSRGVPEDPHYAEADYLSPYRMASIGNQVKLLTDNFPEGDVLEVGVGSGLTAHILRKIGRRVKSLDVEARIEPDILGSVTDIPADNNQFGAFVCCQVLEHIPFKLVPQALSELRRVSRFGGVVSIPTNRTSVALTLYHRTVQRTRVLCLPFFHRPEIACKREHQWELDVNVSRKQFRAAARAAGWEITQELLSPMNLYHYFFVLKPAYNS